jgi:hypothetical protein
MSASDPDEPNGKDFEGRSSRYNPLILLLSIPG